MEESFFEVEFEVKKDYVVGGPVRITPLFGCFVDQT